MLRLLVVLLGVCSLGWCQAVASANTKAQDYSQEGVVIERLATRVVYQADGSGIRESTASIHVQAEAGVKSFAVLAFPYTSANEVVEIDYVRVRKPDGSVVATPEYNIQDMPAEVMRLAPMYSDIHEKHVTVKGLGVGDTLEYVVRYRILKPQIPGHFWFEYSFANDVIAKSEELTIDVPADKYVNVRSPEFKPQEKKNGQRRILEWKASNLQRKADRDSVDSEESSPSVQITTFRSWEEVGTWWRDLQAPQAAVTPAIQAKAVELTKGLTTDDARLRAMYNFVSTHFHYVSLSFGMGRYQPHPAEDVLGNEYGDCKDKHTLLAALLKAVGIEAWPALIPSSRKIDPEVPSPGQFDHVITVIPQRAGEIWLDTTPEVAPLGMLLANLRDKQALIVPAQAAASLKKTPEVPPFASFQHFAAEGKLDANGTFTGHIERVARGDAEVFLRLGFRQVPQAEWKELAQRVSYATGFGGEVSSVQASKPDDTREAFRVSHDYTRKNYGDWENRRVGPPFPPLGIESSDDKKPTKPLILGAPGDLTYKAKMELPVGYTFKLPNNVDLVRDYAEYHSVYSLQGRTLSAERRLVLKKKEVPLAVWDDYCRFRKGLMDDENSWVILEGSKQGGESADSKFDEGIRALDGGDPITAQKAFQRVLEIDPKYQGAHYSIAIIYLAQEDIEAALQELHKEQEVNPTDYDSYLRAAAVLIAKGRRAEATEEWRRLLKADPENREGLLRLSGMLIADQKYGEAAQVLETGMKSKPDDSDLGRYLGKAYLKSGKKEQGLAILQHGLAKSSDAEALNDAAYSLAEADFGLPQAKEWAEQSVRQTESASFKLKSAEGESLVHAANLAARWDTLGWVHFRLGENDKALPYLRAAWKLSQDPVVGDHLSQLHERQGKRSEAALVCQLAYTNWNGIPLGIGPGRSPGGLTPEKEKIRQHCLRLGADPSKGFAVRRLPNGNWSPTLQEQLNNMRTFKISRPARSFTSATFNVVLAPGKVEEVRYVSGDEKLTTMSDDIAHSSLAMEFPDQNPARIMLQGILSCGQAGCDFVLMPLNIAIRRAGITVGLRE